MTSVYRKTDKGLTEVQTRAHHLMPRMRTALIMVDGKRDDDDLRKVIPGEAESTLKMLLDDGYIEVIAVLPDRPAAPVQSERAIAAQATAAGQRAMDEVRRNAARALTEMVGPVAEAVAIRMEKAHNWEELRPALALAQEVLRNTRGAAAAREFGERFIPAATH